ncbi:hypothetical protein RMR16_010475 [Agrobacterium sp. rho-13.3]|uniref:hypothetical protein n=1 Tax=Agrobacterium sp. rho-13.3 TaxID=3072980 RepID=UPI002A0D3B09|nr:hypothetical protein [Agrobacterium sp. rho-13.3]MDX8307811.1 hypothetical protein [Agrobacterium sp. rho-13.3]
MLYDNISDSLVKTPSLYEYLNAFSQGTGQEISLENFLKVPMELVLSLSATVDAVPITSNCPALYLATKKNISAAEVDHDCATLSATDLRHRYPKEYNCWRNMKQRLVAKGVAVHPEFKEFPSFLRKLGPQPALKATIDRINNCDPEYHPGNVRWADKRTQNSNKCDSLLFFDPVSKKSYTTSQLAAIHGRPADTIRKWRSARGWSDAEIVQGFRDTTIPLGRYKSSVHPVSRELTCKEREFKAEAESYRLHRELDGSEALPADYAVIVDLCDGVCAPPTPEQYERKFRSVWPRHRPHVNYDNASEAQQKLINKIDPDYVRAWKARVTSLGVMKQSL